jgi:hypothetical protein
MRGERGAADGDTDAQRLFGSADSAAKRRTQETRSLLREGDTSSEPRGKPDAAEGWVRSMRGTGELPPDRRPDTDTRFADTHVGLVLCRHAPVFLRPYGWFLLTSLHSPGEDHPVGPGAI